MLQSSVYITKIQQGRSHKNICPFRNAREAGKLGVFFEEANHRKYTPPPPPPASIYHMSSITCLPCLSITRIGSALSNRKKHTHTQTKKSSKRNVLHFHDHFQLMYSYFQVNFNSESNPLENGSIL